jgi:predicted metalloprotease with PDZ domain
MRNLPFELTFTKPAGFYAATALVPTSVTAATDVFRCLIADHLYDSPIMYALPDTITLKVGKTDVLIAVYSPNKKATAKYIAQNLQQLLLGTKDYLGGTLPVDKYAFIFYFNGEQPKLEMGGAQEHSYCSFYSIDEAPEKESIDEWVHMAAHEFFHIISPLTISSAEVKEFNFNKAVLSKHLWLYEGSTEYDAYTMQAWSGIIKPEKYLNILSEKISYSRSRMNDSLSFTELSNESAGKYRDEYYNVYEKGALIAACIDLYLLKLSNAKYGLRQLKSDLAIKYGKDKYFEDDSLFSVIAKLSYPEMLLFFKNHVEGGTPIPYEEYFAMAGVEYLPSEDYKDFSLGGLQITPTPDAVLTTGINRMNIFGKRMGYQENDILVSINGLPITDSNLDSLTSTIFKYAKEGDPLTVKVKRKNKKGKLVVTTLQAPMTKVEKNRVFVLRFMPNPSAEQLRIRNAWLNNHAATPDVEVRPRNFYL